MTGAPVGRQHTAVWTEAGELLTFGHGLYGKLGHGGAHDELVSRLLDALAEKKVHRQVLFTQRREEHLKASSGAGGAAREGGRCGRTSLRQAQAAG